MSHIFKNEIKSSLLQRNRSPMHRQQPQIVQQGPTVQQPTLPTDHTGNVNGKTYPVVYSTTVSDTSTAVNMGFLTIPSNSIDGETIENIGGNPNISITVPANIRGQVILKGPSPLQSQGGQNRKKKNTRRSTCKKLRRSKSRRKRSKVFDF